MTIHLRGEESRLGADDRIAIARERLLDAHRRLTRFDPDSELCRLNRDPRAEVPASPLLRRLAQAVGEAGELSGGLVDATVIDSLERAGYRESMEPGASKSRLKAPNRSAPCRPAGPDLGARWRLVHVDEEAQTIVRPPGLRIDSGGIAKGLLADLVGQTLADQPDYAVDCCGDVRIGGGGRLRRVRIGDPFGDEPLGELTIADGGVATSGTARRTWIGADGHRAHHLIDPASGRPASTGIVQATALAPSALLAEIYAKAALLSGPDEAPRWLPHGGALVYEEGGSEIVPNSPDAASVAVTT